MYRHWTLASLLHYANLLSIRVLPWGNFATGLGWNYTSPETMEQLTDERAPRRRNGLSSNGFLAHRQQRNDNDETSRWSLVAVAPPPSGCCKARNARRHLEQHCTQCKMQTGCFCFGCCVAAGAEVGVL